MSTMMGGAECLLLRAFKQKADMGTEESGASSRLKTLSALEWYDALGGTKEGTRSSAAYFTNI